MNPNKNTINWYQVLLVILGVTLLVIPFWLRTYLPFDFLIIWHTAYFVSLPFRMQSQLPEYCLLVISAIFGTTLLLFIPFIFVWLHFLFKKHRLSIATLTAGLINFWILELLLPVYEEYSYVLTISHIYVLVFLILTSIFYWISRQWYRTHWSKQSFLVHEIIMNVFLIGGFIITIAQLIRFYPALFK